MGSPRVVWTARGSLSAVDKNARLPHTVTTRELILCINSTRDQPRSPPLFTVWPTRTAHPLHEEIPMASAGFWVSGSHAFPAPTLLEIWFMPLTIDWRKCEDSAHIGPAQWTLKR